MIHANIRVGQRKSNLKIFLNQSSNGRGGPSTFAKNFQQGLAAKKIQVTNTLTADCRAALFIINANDIGKAKTLNVFAAGRYAGLCHPEWCDKLNKPYDKSANQHLPKEMSQLNHIIFQSNYSRDVFTEVLNKNYKDYSIIYNGADPKVFYPTETTKKDPIVIGCVGVMRYKYRLHTFCELLLKLKQLKYPVKGLIVGPLDNENKEIIKKYKDKLTLSINDRYFTAQELREQYWKMSFLYHPVMGDACPNVVIEAMLSGTPIVCCSYGGQAELVGDSNQIIQVDGKAIERWLYNDNYIEASVEAAQYTIKNLVSIRKQTLIRAQELTLEKMTARYQKALQL